MDDKPHTVNQSINQSINVTAWKSPMGWFCYFVQDSKFYCHSTGVLRDRHDDRGVYFIDWIKTAQSIWHCACVMSDGRVSDRSCRQVDLSTPGGDSRHFPRSFHWRHYWHSVASEMNMERPEPLCARQAVIYRVSAMFSRTQSSTTNRCFM